MGAKTIVLYLCIHNQVKNKSLPLQLKYVTTASHMYYVEVSRLRTLWNCCIAIVIHLTYSWLTVGPPYVPMVSYSM